MVRPPDLIVDPTLLDGPRIDVPSRIGWLLRATRQRADLSLEATKHHVAGSGHSLSAPGLSRLEKQGSRIGAVVSGYEQAAGLTPGRIRAAVDILCRTFPYSPTDQQPHPAGTATLAALDHAVGPVLAEHPTGADWLGFAAVHGGLGRVGLPSRAMRPLVLSLASELGRAVGTSFTTRYEALARLRCGPYEHVVVDVVREIVEDPGTQVIYNLVSAATERPTPELLEWCGRLLSHPSTRVVTAGSLGIQNMVSVGGLTRGEWFSLCPAFLQGVRRAEAAGEHDEESSERLRSLSEVFHALPLTWRRAVERELPVPLVPVATPQGWAGDRSNLHYRVAEEQASQVTTALGVRAEPMLTRLLFELLYDHRVPRGTTAGILVAASPFGRCAGVALRDLADTGPDELTRSRAARGVLLLQREGDSHHVAPWLDDPVRRHLALTIAGNQGEGLDEHRVRELVGSEHWRRALYYAGMTGLSLLHQVAADPDPLRSTAARWWLQHGRRVTR